MPCAPPTIPIRSVGMSFAISMGSMWLTRPILRPTACVSTPRSMGLLPMIPPGAGNGWTGAGAWWNGIRTSPASSCGPWAMKLVMAQISKNFTAGLNPGMDPAPWSMNRLERRITPMWFSPCIKILISFLITQMVSLSGP